MDQNTTVKDLSWFKSHDQGVLISFTYGNHVQHAIVL